MGGGGIEFTLRRVLELRWNGRGFKRCFIWRFYVAGIPVQGG